MPAIRTHFRLHFICLILTSLAVSAALWPTPAGGQAWTATRTRSGLALTLPYRAEHAGRGKLEIEILDPEDKVLGSIGREVNVMPGDGAWKQEISPSWPLPLEDLVWQRVQYRFTYDGESTAAMEETRAVSEILQRPMVRVLGQTAYLAGGEAAIRLIATDTNGNPIAGKSSARVELLMPGHEARVLFAGRLNERDTTDARFRFPAGLIGSYNLHFVAETPLGPADTTQNVQLQDKVSILLTTEKPIYQPGQTIHVRALALDRADHHASTGKLTFEIEDSRGNKVFKKATGTDFYGIASAEFTLADEVNLGTYHLRALTGDPQSPSNTAEIALNVQRYVLPKFKVAVDFAPKDGKPRRDYRPGEHVIGTVHANYFFGKPVANGEITVKASSMDVALNEAGSSSGRTDKEGTYHFDIKLPAYFAGRPLNGGSAPVLIEATVKDSSGHAETRGEPVTVSASALLVTAVPEGGTLIPGLDNQVYVLASYADGTPAEAQLHVRIPGHADQHATTDARGVAVVQMKPSQGNDTLQIEAADQRGNHVTTTISLDSRSGEDQVLLRTDHSTYKAGDRIVLSVLSTQAHSAAYVDVVKDGQTVLTRDLDLVNGRAELTFAATPDMAGTLDISVYHFGRDAQVVGDHRLVFVQPAEELRIDATADAQTYKPGAEARIRFRVTDGHGQGVSAALGMQIVDEAVFALAEKQPGFAKVFFFLEQELMKPRYEIHSLSASDVVEPASGTAEQHDRDVRALFSAAETVNANTLNTQFGRDLPQEKYAEYNQRYRTAFSDQVRALTSTLSEAAQRNGKSKDLSALLAALESRGDRLSNDAWGTPLRLQPVNWMRRRGDVRYYQVESAGPDRQFGTTDDLSQTLEVRLGKAYAAPDTGASAGTTKLTIEHDRGPNNGAAAITGSVCDATGAVIPNAAIELTANNDAKSRHAVSNAAGDFTFAALPVGSYELAVSSPGFLRLSQKLTLQPRDLATLSVSLQVGAVTETVEVGTVISAMEVQSLPMRGRGGMLVANGAMVQDMAVVSAAAPAMQFEARSTGLATLKSTGTAADTHVRSFFPEALYINPEIITDGSGNASITVPIADSITTWRMAMLASTKNGALGTGNSALKVFQDFFVDLDLPVTLTQGDRVTIPVAIYNYAGEHGDVQLKLQPEDWFGLVDDTAEKSVGIDAGQVGAAQFTLEARRIGKFKLTLSARMAGKAERQDIVVREIEVVPNGREQDLVFNGRLDAPAQTTMQQNVQFPAGAIPEASKLFVRLYPGPLSQVVEGMDSILSMPGGCFEQTSSSTYPNVLALDYMKRTKKLTPEVHAKAEGYIANGYQRLLTFEVPGGGFSWFGQAPANKILTAYGLMEFNDMSKVYDVDQKLIARTRDWLIAQQQPDGSWKPDTSFINEGATNRYNSDLLRITAYIAWALENTGYDGPALAKAKEFVQAHMNAKADAYTLAVAANFAVEYGRDQAFTRDAMQRLLDARTEQGEQAWWSSEETGVYSTGTSAAIETTGLAVQALLKSRLDPATTRKALTYLTSKKGPTGTWGTTQATIMALRALLLASEDNSADVRGAVTVLLNGKQVETLQLTPENNDLFHQFVIAGVNDAGANNVQIRFEGTGGLAYQVVGRYFVPWENHTTSEALAVDVKYDRTSLAQNDTMTATATVRNNLPKTANMVMVDLGIPPGFELLSEDLQDFEEKTAGQHSGKLEKFSLTATQAILYFNAFAPGSTVELHFRLRAKYPIHAKTFASRVYEYYDPSVSATAKPVQLEVSGR